MSYFVKDSEELTSGLLAGLEAVYPGICIHPGLRTAILNRDRSQRVALLSGGGAGLEPFGIGFVGENMLTGFVTGPIFDTPPVGSITSAIDHLAKWNGGGIIVIIMNNQSSRLTFGFAVDNARKKGIKIETTLIADDCSLVGATSIIGDSVAERKSLSGAVIYFKILGGMASGGRTMEELLWEERLVKARTASASVCYSSCTVPARGRPHFKMRSGLVSLGCGVNGEDGGRYTFLYQPVDEIIPLLVERLLPRCLLYQPGSMVVLINCYGSLINMEAYVIANLVSKALGSRNITIARMYVGTLMSSLDTKGFIVTLTNVTEKDMWLDMLDLETEAFAWPGTKLSRVNPNWQQRELIQDVPDISEMSGRELDWMEAQLLRDCITAVCRVLMTHKDELDNLCQGTGVELGTEMYRFAEATLAELNRSTRFLLNLANCFLKLSSLAEQTMDTSAAGSIYGLLFIGAAEGAAGQWPEVWEAAVNTLSKYFSAKVGQRSLIDAIVPACSVFRRIIARDGPQSWRTALKAAVETAEEACTQTKSMVSKTVNPVWLEESEGREEAGARAVTIALRAIYGELCKGLEPPGTTRKDRRLSSITCSKPGALSTKVSLLKKEN